MLRTDIASEQAFGSPGSAGQAPEAEIRAPQNGKSKQRQRLLSLLGEAQRTPTPFDLHGLTKTLGSELAAAAGKKGLRSGVFIGTSCPRHVRSDERRLGTLLRGLIRDALQRTAAGSIKLHLDASESEAGLILRFDVTAVATAFDAAEGSKPHAAEGLDQVFAKRLVEQMGGEFGFERVPGKGSSVWFTLPAEFAPGPLHAAEAASKLKGRVLAVVHNGLSQRLITTYLNEFGVSCDLVGAGSEALKRLASASYDAMLMDMATPELDGVKTVEQVRKLDRPAAEIPIIALIWHATKENRQEYLVAGLDGYVAKPIRGRELYAALAAHLPGSGTVPAATKSEPLEAAL